MKHFLTFSLIVLTFFSCGQYQKILKSDDVNFKYSEAVKYYKNSEFNKALPIFNELLPIFKGTSKSEEISYYFEEVVQIVKSLGTPTVVSLTISREG